MERACVFLIPPIIFLETNLRNFSKNTFSYTGHQLGRKQNSAICVNWEIECSCRSRVIVCPSLGSVGDQWSKALVNIKNLALN